MEREAERWPRRPDGPILEARRPGFRGWWNRLTLFQAFMLGPVIALAVLIGIAGGLFVLWLLAEAVLSFGYR